ncbi:hypothetical protein TeGR_g2905, partial [Tetraparma gracilis]
MLLDLFIKHAFPPGVSSCLSLAHRSHHTISPSSSITSLSSSLSSPPIFELLLSHLKSTLPPASLSSVLTTSLRSPLLPSAHPSNLSLSLAHGATFDMSALPPPTLLALAATFLEDHRFFLDSLAPPANNPRAAAHSEKLVLESTRHWRRTWTSAFWSLCVAPAGTPKIVGALVPLIEPPAPVPRPPPEPVPAPAGGGGEGADECIVVVSTDGVSTPLPISPFPKLAAYRSFASLSAGTVGPLELSVDSAATRAMSRWARTGRLPPNAAAPLLLELVYLGDEWQSPGLTRVAAGCLWPLLGGLEPEVLLDVACVDDFGLAELKALRFNAAGEVLRRWKE